jgi:hypothetical protein
MLVAIAKQTKVVEHVQGRLLSGLVTSTSLHCFYVFFVLRKNCSYVSHHVGLDLRFALKKLMK